MAGLTHYRIRTGDTLEGIAGRFLGSSGRWPELVVLNNLRAPFVSDEPLYRLGPVLYDTTLGTRLPAGSDGVALALPSAALARADCALFLVQPGPLGAPTWETLVLAVDARAVGGATQLAFRTPATKDWEPYARAYLCAPASTATSRVLATGDVLRLPPDAQGGAPEIAPDAQLTARLGTDVVVSQDTGLLAWDPHAHDLALVAGTANIVQAIWLRLMTATGELPYHQTYGNALLHFIGRRETSTFPSLAAGLVRTCLNAEARLERVEQVRAQVQGDVVTLDVTAMLRGLAQLISINALGVELRH